MKKKNKSTIHIDSELHYRLKIISGNLDAVFYKFIEKILYREADKLARQAGCIQDNYEKP